MAYLEKPKKQKGSAHYKKIADQFFSKYIRYRDGQRFVDESGEEVWYTVCITCGDWKPMSQMHAGHFMSRRYMSTRYDEFNVNGQCAKCNTFNAGEQYKYSLAVDEKYGKGVAEQLSTIAQQTKKFTVDDFLKIIADAKKEIAYYESL